MANKAVLGGLAVLLIGGAAAWVWLGGEAEAGLDRVGAQLVARVAAERDRDVVDPAVFRKLLHEVQAYRKQSVDVHPEVSRAEAWLHLQLGNSQKAWDALQDALGVTAEPASMILAVHILKARHAETGLADPAEQGMILAEDHYLATRAVSSLFLGWQLAVRVADADRTKRFVGLLAVHPESPECRTAIALAKLPEVDQSPEALAGYRKLLDDFAVPPEELLLAIAWCEVGSGDAILTGLKRAEAVMESYRSSVMARTLIALASLRLERWERTLKYLDDLLRSHPGHNLTEFWRNLQVAAVAGAAKAR
jgi:tetratricopeptide (TPR) repeat protein